MTEAIHIQKDVPTPIGE